MAEYIERESFFKFLTGQMTRKQNGAFAKGFNKGIMVARAAVHNKEITPAADVVEVVHGHNKTSMHPVDEFLCSVCGFCCADYTETKYDENGDYEYSCECEFDYCPNCGAKMDGERRSE